MSDPGGNPRKSSASYMQGLGPPEKARYIQKLNFIGGQDPYELSPLSWTNDDPKILPSIKYPDIVNYLIFSPSPYTSEDRKAYKGKFII